MSRLFGDNFELDHEDLPFLVDDTRPQLRVFGDFSPLDYLDNNEWEQNEPLGNPSFPCFVNDESEVTIARLEAQLAKMTKILNDVQSQMITHLNFVNQLCYNEQWFGHSQSFEYNLPLKLDHLKNEETPYIDAYDGFDENDMSICVELAIIVYSCAMVTSFEEHKEMHENEDVNRCMYNEKPLNDFDAQCDIKGKTQNKFYVSFDEEDMNIFREIANMFEKNFVDVSKGEMSCDIEETLDVEPLNKPCREQSLSMVAEDDLGNVKSLILIDQEEEKKEVPTMEEQEWYKIEFIEDAPQVFELKYLLKGFQMVPYIRHRSACERAFFWYRDGYSES